MSDSTDNWPPVSEREQHDSGFLVPGYEAREERARILALLADAAVVEDMARAPYREGDWDDLTPEWQDMHRGGMRAALDVLRARIEEDR